MPGADILALHRRPPDKRLLDSGAAHARIYSEWRHLDAFKTLTALQRVLLEDILMDFTKVVGNTVRLTATGLMTKYKTGRPAARKALAGLEERGWIYRIGLSTGPTGQAGGVYEILCIDARGRRVAGPYMQWAAIVLDRPIRPSE